MPSLYCRETSFVMCRHLSFLVTQGRKSHCYYKHWDWWDFCYNYWNCLQSVNSSLTFRWKTTLEKSVGRLLLVKSSLGDFFCFIHSFGTVPASWRWGDGELERELELFGVCLYKNAKCSSILLYMYRTFSIYWANELRFGRKLKEINFPVIHFLLSS